MPAVVQRDGSREPVQNSTTRAKNYGGCLREGNRHAGFGSVARNGPFFLPRGEIRRGHDPVIALPRRSGNEP